MMKKIFLLFAFAIAALCTVNVEARKTRTSPEKSSVQRRIALLRPIAAIQPRNRRPQLNPIDVDIFGLQGAIERAQAPQARRPFEAQSAEDFFENGFDIPDAQ
jgi:hypothetical protein